MILPAAISLRCNMDTPYDTNLPPHLRSLQEEIEGYAREYGLDFFRTIFEVIDADDLNEIAAYGGFPTRYPHWSFGMAYEELRKGYDYGLSKIYEMVINNDPCYAYLMRSNHTVDQKLVMAHVYGHCLAPETLIETEDGAKPITEIRVGDRVLTHTGIFKRVRVVARRWFSGEISCIRVEGSCETVRITGEHPVGIAHDDFELKWVPARELGGGMLVAMPRAGELIPVRASIMQCSPGRYFDLEEPHAQYDDLYEWRAILKPFAEKYEGFVYNFSVEEDESYTLAAGFVVHNCDFFKNNAYFAHTNRKMMDEMANHGARIRSYVERFGEDEVESFLDRCMSIDDLIDVHSTAIRRREPVSRYDFAPEKDDNEELRATRFKSKDYMDDYINPRELLKKEEEERRKAKEQTARSFPEHPEKDILLFLIEHAPLKNWQRDVLEIVRDEAYYFAPQGQTKVMNEGWACLRSGMYVFTTQGLRTIDQVVKDQLSVGVSDGKHIRSVYDWAKFKDRETVWIRTRRGLELEGSVTHRLMLPDGSWRRLDEIQIGGRVSIGGGGNLWAEDYVRLDWQPARPRITLQEAATRVGVDIETVIRYRAGVRGRHNDKLAAAVLEYDNDLVASNRNQRSRRAIRVPEILDERLGAFLGYLIGDGHISRRKRIVGLTTGDESQADRFHCLAEDLFGVCPRKKWDQTKWRIGFCSRSVGEFLVHLGLKPGVSARLKNVPEGILRSPKPVVAAFLRAYYDCEGYAGKAGVILSTSSTEMSKTVQLLLLNFGILSTRRPNKDGCWHVHTTGKSAAVFLQEIGFGLQRKQDALREYVQRHKWFLKEEWEDEIIAIERRRADVYDISVEETHRYAAQGFINHNSYWHSTMMTQKILTPSEMVDYADHHSGTMATSRTRINPYKLGIELLRDIEHRWNTGKFGKEYEECDDLEKRRNWDKQLGLGRQKIFEVRRVHNDITFIDTFLTPEFCVQHNMFTFAWQEQAGGYFIESRDFEKIKQRLLFSLTNFGKPWIYVVDGNFRNRGELLLKHQHTGVELRLDQAADTLANIQFIWGRPVHLQTLVDGKPTTLSFDGTEHSIKTGGETDEPRRTTTGKNR
jgi:stage V sporulation protein R